jgi:hypothetical protein
MALSPRHQLLRDRANRAFGQHEVGAAVARVRAIIGGAIPSSSPEAQRARKQLDDDVTPTLSDMAALEYYIRMMRAAPLCRYGQVQDLPAETNGSNLYSPEFREQWTNFCQLVQPLIKSVGRVENRQRQLIGTAFQVAPELVATNRHVLNLLTNGLEEIAAGSARINFGHEYQVAEAPDCCAEVVNVAGIHPSQDMVLLRVGPSSRAVISFDHAMPAAGAPMAAVGYPADDPGRNPLFMKAIFASHFCRRVRSQTRRVR